MTGSADRLAWQRAQPGQGLAYRFLATCFHEPPGDEWLARLADEELLDAWPFPTASEECSGGLDLLRAFCRRRDTSTIEEAACDFARLFVGPGKMLAPPWESVYTSRTGLTFQESTLKVRELYRSFDLEVPALHREPDDHLALELAFIAHLSELATTAASQDDPERLEACHEMQQRFLAQHLSTWAPDCLALVETHAETDYYRGLGRLTLATLRESARLLGHPGDRSVVEPQQ